MSAVHDLLGGLACDLRASPWRYPGPPLPAPGVLVGDRLHVTDDAVAVDAVLRREGVAPIRERHLLVAVGSNGSPDVLRAKLARAGVSGVVPFVRCTLAGIAVGHSAHVSRPGFVAAAPFRSPGARTAAVASLLDDEQLAAVDETELTYTRRPVAVGVGGPDGADVEDGWLYDTDCGVLATAPGSGVALTLRSQAELLARLVSSDAGLARLLGGDDPGAVLPALAADESRRVGIRAWLARDWALPTGLAGMA